MKHNARRFCDALAVGTLVMTALAKTAQITPEPTSAILAGMGLLFLFVIAKRRF